MTKRFLNIRYAGTETRINIENMADLTEVQDKIKEKFANALAQVDAPYIRLSDQEGAVISKWTSINTLPEEYYAEDGLYLAVSTSAPLLKKQRLSPKPEWKKELKFIYALDKGKMFFANRAAAVGQLQRIHHSKYERVIEMGEGENWIIPIADNVIGLGKTAFGRHYIQKCREETWPDVDKRTDFQKTLCDCHTVIITFQKGALLNENTLDAVMIERFLNVLTPMFNVEPQVLSDPPDTAGRFLELLTLQAGPVFIVLDEIGDAFDGGNFDDVQRREMFLFFCDEVLGKWLMLKNVFFLVLGRGSFLSYVGLRPFEFIVKPSKYIYERLNLHLLRPDAIQLILQNTLVAESLPDGTIQKSFDLNEDQCKEAALDLYAKTNGHPRSLLKALNNCNSLSDILDYNEPVEFTNWEMFYNGLFRNRDAVSTLLFHMNSGQEFDLTKNANDSGKNVTFDIIASNSFISWEGTVMKARLYTHPIVGHILDNFLSPLKEYLKQVGKSNRISIDYPTVFEWMFLKRFQELFSIKQQPSMCLPLFLSTPIFGNCFNVRFSGFTRPIPKITISGSRVVTLDSETAHPDCWKSLLKQITDLGDVCLKPRPKTSSSDAILVASADFQDSKVILTLGLAVKNFGPKTLFSKKHFDQECVSFNRMFDGAEDLEGSKNVLIICSTAYAKEFDFTKSFLSCDHTVLKKYPNISEVVLLDLSSSLKRSKFFGVESDLSILVESVVAKAEKGFDYEPDLA